MSFRLRPLVVNFEVMLSRGSKGDGISVFAKVILAVMPSRRPMGKE